MVKIEDFVENGGIGPDVGALVVQPAAAVDAVDSRPASGQIRVKEEESQPSSSFSHLRSHFVGMGFSPTLVDKVLEENGGNDADSILESLLSHSALQKSGSESSGSLGGLFDSDNEENSSPFEFRKERNQEIKPEPDSFSEKRSYLLGTMNFSEREVDLAFNQLGETAPLEQLVDYIVTAQVAGFSGGNQNGDATNEGKAEGLFGVMDKTLYLLQMGFTEEEVSSAIDNFGPEVSVLELADSIFASRIAGSIENKEVKMEYVFLGDTETEYSSYHASSSNAGYYDDEEKMRSVKRAKHIFIDDKGASSSLSGNQASLSPWVRGCWAKSTDERVVKEEPDMMTPGLRANVRGALAKPPYFFYGNVVEISKDTWRKLSQFLFSVEPEFVNSQFFSALIRREGYIHNLPTERRHAVVPKSPMTIEDALPFTRQWWPSWDTRKQISGINTEAAGIEQICEKLGKMMRDSRGVLSREQQTHIFHQCRASNLIWVGQDRLSPLEPRQVERILGYPPNHTQLFGLNPPDRLAAMKYCFQTGTLAYLLSVLKDIYPDGLRVLSIYSGIGGAEIALHRLGIPLRCVVSIEGSDVNRKILKRWWGKTEQTGELRQLGGIWRLTTQTLEDLVKEFGGFDLVVGGNPSACSGGSTINSLMGMDSNLFFEFVRVVQRVRSIVGSNS